jgi:predicted nuclease with RNAse H fold
MELAVGIDVAEPSKGLDLVALDVNRSVIESAGKLTVEDAVRLIASLRPAVVCIDSPSGWSVSGKSRLAERELAAIGIQSYRTGPNPGAHPFYEWIRVGLRIYESIATVYPLDRGGAVAGSAAEIFPHATASLLARELRGGTPKVAFRRAVLRAHGVAEHGLPSIDRVDAALGALTGRIALEGGHSAVGDPAEGMILLPVQHLPEGPLPVEPANLAASAQSEPLRESRRPQGATVQIGYVNRNNQNVVAATGLPGTDHGQSIYVLRCGQCGEEYASNGSDNFQRKCPACQGGAPGLGCA